MNSLHWCVLPDTCLTSFSPNPLVQLNLSTYMVKNLGKKEVKAVGVKKCVCFSSFFFFFLNLFLTTTQLNHGNKIQDKVCSQILLFPVLVKNIWLDSSPAGGASLHSLRTLSK